MAREIKPISLLPLTEGQKKALIHGADSSTKMYPVSIGLSETPNQQCIQIFNAAWFKEYGSTSVPRISGKTVIVTATIQNLQNVVNGLKLLLPKANEEFEAFIKREDKKQQEAKQQKDESKKAAEKTMSEALDALKF